MIARKRRDRDRFLSLAASTFALLFSRFPSLDSFFRSSRGVSCRCNLGLNCQSTGYYFPVSLPGRGRKLEGGGGPTCPIAVRSYGSFVFLSPSSARPPFARRAAREPFPSVKQPRRALRTKRPVEKTANDRSGRFLRDRAAPAIGRIRERGLPPETDRSSGTVKTARKTVRDGCPVEGYPRARF